MSTLGSDEELRTGEKENAIYIKEEVIENETQCADELDIKDSHSLYKTENNIGMKEEFSTSGNNADIEFCHVYVKCESIPSDSDVPVSRIENNVHEDSKYSNSNSKINLTKSKESCLFYETENNFGIKNECPTFEDNGDIEFYHEYVKSIKCESVSSDSDVSVSKIEDIVHEDSEYSNSDSKTNKLIKHTEKNVTEQNNIKKIKNSHCALSSKILLQYYLKGHSGIRDYSCTICRKRFMQKSNLVRHENIHTGIKNYECALCKKTFMDKCNLVEHEKIHTGIKHYECALCKKRFMYKGTLVQHEKIHTGIKNYECLICKKTFMDKCNLVKHEKIHTGIKNYECALCKKKFITKSNLVEHEKIHTGIKKYECALCKKKFTNKGSLVVHEKIHTDIKNFECAVCKRKFMHKDYLVKHEKIHTGIRNYECALCKKKFIHKYDLVKHEKIHKGIKSYECEVCKRKFTQKITLVRHEKIHTNRKQSDV